MSKYVGHFTFSDIEANNEKEALQLIWVCLFVLLESFDLDPSEEQIEQAGDIRMQLKFSLHQ